MSGIYIEGARFTPPSRKEVQARVRANYARALESARATGKPPVGYTNLRDWHATQRWWHKKWGLPEPDLPDFMGGGPGVTDASATNTGTERGLTVKRADGSTIGTVRTGPLFRSTVAGVACDHEHKLEVLALRCARSRVARGGS